MKVGVAALDVKHLFIASQSFIIVTEGLKTLGGKGV
jgi:hypothetical protein